eukprot:gene16755-23027_t
MTGPTGQGPSQHRSQAKPPDLANGLMGTRREPSHLVAPATNPEEAASRLKTLILEGNNDVESIKVKETAVQELCEVLVKSKNTGAAEAFLLGASTRILACIPNAKNRYDPKKTSRPTRGTHRPKKEQGPAASRSRRERRPDGGGARPARARREGGAGEGAAGHRGGPSGPASPRPPERENKRDRRERSSKGAAGRPTKGPGETSRKHRRGATADEVPSIISFKAGLKYTGADVDAMRSVAKAYQDRSLQTLQYGPQLTEDPIIKTHLNTLYETLMEQNLIRIIEPFSRVEMSHVASLIQLPLETVENKLSQGAGCVEIFDSPAAEKVYPTSLGIIESMGRVVDTLFTRSQRVVA